ncbi:MAG: phosphotransferase, partial [Blastochloris sp.]|nr:phosphotransferase [Blastochloris sp.]
LTYENLLDRHIDGSLSKIHGDLHLGNILVGPGDNPFLIDFARTHDGHALADWAMLEVSLLSDVVMPVAGDDWDAARQVAEQVVALNTKKSIEQDGAVASALEAVLAVRGIVQGCLQIEISGQNIIWRWQCAACAPSPGRRCRSPAAA